LPWLSPAVSRTRRRQTSALGTEASSGTTHKLSSTILYETGVESGNDDDDESEEERPANDDAIVVATLTQRLFRICQVTLYYCSSSVSIGVVSSSSSAAVVREKPPENMQ